MKLWALFTVIAVIISVCLVSSYAGISINSSVSRPGILNPRSSSQAPPRSAPIGAAVGSPYVSPSSMAPLDPNKVAAAVRAFPGLEQELTRVGRGSRAEVTEWLRPVSTTTDNRSRLAREVQRQVAIELDFLRKIAIGEGAKKTAAAIDGIQLVRESRLKKLTQKMDEEKRSARTAAGSTRSSRTSGRTRGGTTASGTESRGRYSNYGNRRPVEGEGALQEDATTTSTRRRR